MIESEKQGETGMGQGIGVVGFLKQIAAIGLAFAILVVSIGKSNLVVSQEKMAGETIVVTSPTPTPRPTVDYYLPYPGILPDHFLYPVKMTRDWFWQTFTFDPQRKADVYLLMADKRLNAAKVLIEGGKGSLGISTASKAEKYLEKAFMQAKKAEENGEQMSEFWEKINLSAAKHDEVLTSLGDRISGDGKGEWDKAIGYAEMVGEKSGQEMAE